MNQEIINMINFHYKFKNKSKWLLVIAEKPDNLYRNNTMIFVNNILDGIYPILTGILNLRMCLLIHTVIAEKSCVLQSQYERLYKEKRPALRHYDFGKYFTKITASNENTLSEQYCCESIIPLAIILTDL
ncbi:hypothetical protein PIROE2DRAFT_16641 [Piromyces sp. E2]|nr:hypothetical protein PIROE2DRAFT_16641 [Piromyces sp. E2]|eukprot:OUM58162.1 hypothetical protein PIROE2DRAFT_16641 [Piromyces sp. E2]